MREDKVIREVRLYLGQQPDVVVHRNQVGQAEYYDKHGKAWQVPHGLCKGSSDLIGMLAPSGRYIAFECKATKGRVTPEQQQFLNLVRRTGGFACVVRSARDAEFALIRARKGERE